jgi:hypothetical protein
VEEGRKGRRKESGRNRHGMGINWANGGMGAMGAGRRSVQRSWQGSWAQLHLWKQHSSCNRSKQSTRLRARPRAAQLSSVWPGPVLSVAAQPTCEQDLLAHDVRLRVHVDLEGLRAGLLDLLAAEREEGRRGLTRSASGVCYSGGTQRCGKHGTSGPASADPHGAPPAYLSL